MKTNKLMNDILKKYRILERQEKITLDLELASILNSGIVKIGECYFFNKFAPIGIDIVDEIEEHQDFTGIESFYNHFHIEDNLSINKASIKITIQQGVKFAIQLHELLPKEVHFQVVLSCSFKPIFDCNVRFFKKRFGEIWVLDNLDSYIYDAIMVLEKTRKNLL